MKRIYCALSNSSQSQPHQNKFRLEEQNLKFLKLVLALSKLNICFKYIKK